MRIFQLLFYIHLIYFSLFLSPMKVLLHGMDLFFSVSIFRLYIGILFRILKIRSLSNMTLTAAIYRHYTRFTKPGKDKSMLIFISSVRKLLKTK